MPCESPQSFVNHAYKRASFHSRIFGYQAIQRKLSLAITAEAVNSRILKPMVDPISNFRNVHRGGPLCSEKFLKPPRNLGRFHGWAAELCEASGRDSRMYDMRSLRRQGIPHRLSKTVKIVYHRSVR